MDIKISLDGMEETLQALSTKEYFRAIGTALKKSIVIVEGAAKKEVPVNTGQLRQGFRTYFKGTRAILRNVREYATWVHEGTQPHRAPIGPLAKRAKAKGLNPYAVRHGIAMRGTKPNKFMDRAADSTEVRVRRVFTKSIDLFYSNK